MHTLPSLARLDKGCLVLWRQERNVVPDLYQTSSRVSDPYCATVEVKAKVQKSLRSHHFGAIQYSDDHAMVQPRIIFVSHLMIRRCLTAFQPHGKTAGVCAGPALALPGLLADHNY